MALAWGVWENPELEMGGLWAESIKIGVGWVGLGMERDVGIPGRVPCLGYWWSFIFSFSLTRIRLLGWGLR